MKKANRTEMDRQIRATGVKGVVVERLRRAIEQKEVRLLMMPDESALIVDYDLSPAEEKEIRATPPSMRRSFSRRGLFIVGV